jgi:hypothetical protein
MKGFTTMLRMMNTVQRKSRVIFIQVDGSDVNGGTLTTNGIDMGADHVKITETGNGAYTITLNEPGTRACFAMISPTTDNSICYVGACAAATVAVTQETASTGAALADADFNVMIVAFDSENET